MTKSLGNFPRPISPAGFEAPPVLPTHARPEIDVGLRDVPYDFRGKHVLDLDAGSGKHLRAIGLDIAHGVGVCREEAEQHIAGVECELRGTSHVTFVVLDPQKPRAADIDAAIPEDGVHIALLLGCEHRRAAWRSKVDYASRRARHILFDTRGTPDEQVEQLEYVRRRFPKVTYVSNWADGGPWQRKRYYLAEDRWPDDADREHVTPTEATVKELVASHLPKATPTDDFDILTMTGESDVALLPTVVLKFARPGLERYLRTQAGWAQLFHGRVSRPVPTWTLVEDDPERLWMYGPRLPGLRADHAGQHDLKSKKWQRFADQLAEWMASAHAIEPRTYLEANCFAVDNDLFDEDLAQAPFLEQLPPAYREWLDSAITTVGPRVVPPAERRVVGHFDLHGSNILVDPETFDITGVVDFGHAGIADYADEFWSLNLSFPDLTPLVIQRYAERTGRHVDITYVDACTTRYVFELIMRSLENQGSARRSAKRVEAWRRHCLKSNRGGVAPGDDQRFDLKKLTL